MGRAGVDGSGAVGQGFGAFGQGGGAGIQRSEAGVQLFDLGNDVLGFPGGFGKIFALLQGGEQGRNLTDFGSQIRADSGVELFAGRINGIGGGEGHSPAQIRVIRLEGNREGSGEIQGSVHAGDGPAHQDSTAHDGQHRGVFQLQIRNAFLRQDHRGDSQGGNRFRGGIRDGEGRVAGFFLQIFGGDFRAVQGEGHYGKQGGRFVRGSLIGDIPAVCLPDEGFPVEGEGLVAADVFNTRQQGAIRDFIRVVGVFQTDVVREAFHGAVGGGNDIDALMLGVFRQGRGTGQQQGQGAKKGDDFFQHGESFLSGLIECFTDRRICADPGWCAQ